MKTLLPSLALAALIGSSALAAQAGQPPSPSDPAAGPPTAASPPTPPGAVNPSPNPASGPPAPSASTGASSDTAANAGASTVMSGMSVKDNTGALIGEVKSVKGGVATIQMGSDSFTVDTNKLGVSNGVANINASQAELKKMLPPKK